MLRARELFLVNCNYQSGANLAKRMKLQDAENKQPDTRVFKPEDNTEVNTVTS